MATSSPETRTKELEANKNGVKELDMLGTATGEILRVAGGFTGILISNHRPLAMTLWVRLLVAKVEKAR